LYFLVKLILGMKMERKLRPGERVCLFCGETMKQKWEEYDTYYECDCEDAVKDRDILTQIQRLEDSRPRERCCIERVDMLYKD